MPTAAILIAIIFLSLLLIYYYNTVNPSFRKEGFSIKKCPAGTTSYITDDGSTNCCSSEVIDNTCRNIFCSLSPGSNNCADVLISQVRQRSAAKCPTTVSGDCNNYFTNSSGTVKGCSKSSLNSDFSGPSDLSQSYCRLYDTASDNTTKYDSCQNYLARYNLNATLVTTSATLATTVAALETCRSNGRLAAQATTVAECTRLANIASPPPPPTVVPVVPPASASASDACAAAAAAAAGAPRPPASSATS
jgi:hypothetical protein